MEHAKRVAVLMMAVWGLWVLAIVTPAADYTPEQLGEPGALQAAIDAGGPIHLGPGVYEFDRTLVIPLRYGGKIVGAGMSPKPAATADAFRGRLQGTVLRYTGPPEAPAIRLGPAQGFRFQDLTIECDKGGLGVLYPFMSGFAAAINRFEMVAFLTEGIGFQAGENPTDGNCADVVFDQCYWGRCERAFVAKNHQAVNFHFSWNTWSYCNTCIETERGGLVTALAPVTFGCDTFLRTGEGGIGSPNQVLGGSFDRSSGEPFITIVDASDAVRDSRTAVLGAVKVTGAWKEGAGHDFFKYPSRSKWAPWGQVIDTSSMMLSTAVTHANHQPTPEESDD